MQGLNVYQIGGQSEPEHHSKNGYDIDEGAGRMMPVTIAASPKRTEVVTAPCGWRVVKESSDA